ncbi:MAG TPA: Hsp33 family molecular chaperone HslO [Pseudogracilibacillus sp.]|nr:Hsp33 family molecular chaperone HslO [Pseudogracilibacillus sp.]
MNDYIVKSTVFDGMVRAYAVITTDMVEEARRRQDTWATASAALGRTLTVTALIGSMMKGEDTITVKIEGNGPLGAIITDGNAHGNVRGYVKNPHVDFPLNEHGKLDVKRAVGEGTLSIVKDYGLKEYFTGQVPLVSGEISEDFTYYFAHSEQTPSAVGAGVLINPDHSILAAGGFIVQLMPGATETIISSLEKAINEFPPISTLVKEGNSPEQILQRLFANETINFHERVDVQFSCNCSIERIERAIIGLGKEEIKNMIDEDGGAEITCHFCNEHYTLSEVDLQKLLEK